MVINVSQKDFILNVSKISVFLVYRYPFAKIPGISSAGKGRLNR